MAHARSRFRGEEIAGRRLEKLQHRGVLERGRVGHVDDDVRPGEDLGQALAGEGVDARVRRRRQGLMSLLTETGDGLRPE